MQAHDLVGGRYRLIETIRGSAVGRDWLAYDELLDRLVTLQPVDGSGDGGRRLATARIDEPGAAVVYDVLALNGTSWIVMEHVPRDRAVGTAAIPPAPPPPARIARSTRIAVVVAVLLLVATSGAALALDRAGPPPPAAAPDVAAIVDCTPITGTPVTGVSGPPVPPGWVWHRDPAGFQLAVPDGWTWRTDGDTSCFHDPRGDRSLRVLANGPVVADAVGHWTQAEAAALGAGALPGYRRIGIAPLNLRAGGADWEYTWQPAGGGRRHERQLLLAIGPGRAYVLDWSSDDASWSTSEPLLQQIVASVEAR